MAKRLGRLLDHIESPPPPFLGRGEAAFAILSAALVFAYKLFDLRRAAGIDWAAAALPAAFTATAFSFLTLLATPAGTRIAGRAFAGGGAFLAMLPPGLTFLYVGVGKLTGAAAIEAETARLAAWFWPGTPAWAGLAVSLAVMYGTLRAGMALAAAGSKGGRAEPAPGWPGAVLGAAAALSIPAAADAWLLLKAGTFFAVWGLALLSLRPSLRRRGGFSPGDFLATALTALPFLFMQSVVPLAWCYSTPAAVLVMVYATGLGREHFNFSFVPRSGRDAVWAFILLFASMGVLLGLAHGMGSIRASDGLWKASAGEIFSYVVVFVYIVGFSEEVIFRCGLMTLIADWVRAGRPGRGLGFIRQRPVLFSLFLVSFLFGAVHAPRGLDIAVLAALAGLAYGLAFVAGKSLFGAVLLHAVIDIIAILHYKIF